MSLAPDDRPDAPALRRTPAPPASALPHVPAALSDFVGRARDLAEVGVLLGRARLVTLAGAGGVGKTRLAREAIARAAAPGAPDQPFPDGVWWVELAALPTGAEPTSAVAAALGVRQPLGTERAGALVDTLAEALTARRLLVVLDNCEHVVEGAAALADVLLRRCPGLALLATSREALGIEGEIVWPLQGLPHPATWDLGTALARDDGRDDAAGHHALCDEAAEAFARELAGYEAVELFVARARAVQPDFALTTRTAQAVAAITARLGGQPLALELAAAQVRVLGVDALATRLDDVFAVLTRGRRTALPRQRTLRALLDWSYHLLAPAERALLAQLSVFRGAFTLDAVALVCAGRRGDGALDSAGVLHAFGRLVEQSLVQVRDDEGEVRYALLEPVRQYGAGLLAGTPDEAPVRDRHLGWAAALVADAEPRLLTRARRAEIERLGRYIEDLRSAVHWASDAAPVGPSGAAVDAAAVQARAVGAMTVAGGLMQFWVATGAWDGARRLDAAARRAAARAGLSFDGDPKAEAERAARVAPEVRRAAGRLLFVGAGLALLTGDPDAALAEGERTLAWLRVERDHAATPAERREAERWRAWTYLVQFEPHLLRGAVEEARAVVGAASAAAAASGDDFVIAYAAFRAAAALALAGDAAAAAAACERVLPWWRANGNPPMLCTALSFAADLARGRGDVGTAAGYVREALAVVGRDAHADRWSLARAVVMAAAVCADRAESVARTAAISAGGGADPRDAGGHEAGAHAADAARLLGTASALRIRAGVTDPLADVAIQAAARHAAEVRLGAPAFARAWAEGERLGPVEAVAFADRVLAACPQPLAPAPAEDTTGAPPGALTAVVARVAVDAGAHLAPSTSSAPEVEVLAFGPLAVMRGEVAVPSSELTPAKVRELLLYLVLHPTRTKEQIALALWPDASPAQLRNIFHVTMHQLRRALGHKDAVAFDGGAYALARAAGADDDASVGTPAGAVAGAVALRCDVDTVLDAADALRTADRSFEQGGVRETSAAAAAHADAAALARWHGALNLARRGGLGEGVDAGEWLDGPRARVSAAWASGMEALARLYARQHAPHEATAVLEALVAAEPLREGAHRALMAGYVDAGEPGRAVAHYHALVALLAREFGAAPARETAALLAAIRRSDAR